MPFDVNVCPLHCMIGRLDMLTVTTVHCWQSGSHLMGGAVHGFDFLTKEVLVSVLSRLPYDDNLKLSIISK